MVERPNSVTLFHFFIYIDFISSLIMAIQSDWYSNISEWAFLKPQFYKLPQPRLRQNHFTVSHGVSIDPRHKATSSRQSAPIIFPDFEVFKMSMKFLLNRCSHYAYRLPTFVSPILITKSSITIFVNTCIIIFTGFRQSSPFGPS